MNSSVINMIIFGSGKTTFCSLMNRVYQPFCPAIIDMPICPQTTMCKVYNVANSVFNTVHRINLIDTPHTIENIGNTFLMVEPSYMVYLIDLSKPEELANILGLVREASMYYDCNNKLFIGINRGEKIISDDSITSAMAAFSNSKYLEISICKGQDGKFIFNSLLDNFNIVTQHVYRDLTEDFERPEEYDESLNNYYDYIQRYIDVTFPSPARQLRALHDEFNDFSVEILFQNNIPQHTKKIIKNSNFVTREYFNRNIDNIKCCICFDNIKDISNFVYTWCGHEYCSECYPKIDECFCKTVMEL